MFSYKQRYRPRTEREYTKTDLTVYDSAGNTALRGLKVYGKSEAVDGDIVSAGDSGSITITSNSNITNLITSIIQGTVGASGELLPDYTTRVMTTPIYIEPNTKIFLNSNSTAQVYEVNEWDENDNYLGYFGINNVSGNYTLKATTHKIIVTFRYSNNAYITPEIVPNATITLSPIYTTSATFTTGTPMYGIDENTRDVMTWDGVSGEVTKKCAKVRLADLAYGRSTAYDEPIFYSGDLAGLYLSSPNVIALCSKYAYIKTTTARFFAKNAPDKSIGFNTDTKTQLYIKDLSYNTPADLIAALSDAELIYELATPTITPLTQTENESIAGLRTFDGTTHFTNNASTDMTVNYTIKVPTIS